MAIFDWVVWAFTPVRKFVAIVQLLVLPHQPYQPPTVLGQGVYETLQAAVFFLTENNLPDGQPVGVGFCVGNKNKTITAHHNLPPNSGVGTRLKGFFGSPHVGNSLDMEVTYVSPQLDLAILKITYSTFAHQSLRIHTITPNPGTECILAAFQISLTEQLRPDIEISHSVGIFRGTVVKLHPRHLCYDCPSFWRCCNNF